ncbi:MAG: hypothetical protein ABSH15_10920 [Verrucomicrobiota bacterium]|jgi:hypothetical protein
MQTYTPAGLGRLLKIHQSIATWFLMVFLLGLGNSFATTFLQFDSTYLGDGWFQYRMQVMNDPFFTEADIIGLQINFTNQIDQSTDSQNWTNYDSDNAYSCWFFSQSYPARPYEEVFLVRSAETSYRLGTNNGVLDGVLVVFSLYLADFNPWVLNGDVSANIVGYAAFPCLVPCPPEQADGSPTNFSYTLKLLPDISIQQLIQSNGVVSGVDFLWDYDSTLLLQASTDLTTWTNVTYIWSVPPETLWITNTPLNDFGQFFRLELVADGYQTNLPPLTSNAVLAKPAASRVSVAPLAAIPRVSGCQMIKGKIAVSVATQPNQHYSVSALDSHKVVQATQPLTAAGNSATVYFDAQSLPTPVFFQVAATSAP